MIKIKFIFNELLITENVNSNNKIQIAMGKLHPLFCPRKLTESNF